MATRSLSLVVQVFIALGAACGGDRMAGPTSQVLGRLNISPTSAVLTVGKPLQLKAVAYDLAGAFIVDPGPIIFSSTNSTIARVSSDGWVTGVAPGSTSITAALTRGGVTRTTSTIVTAFSQDIWDIYGTYDLTAQVTSFDPAWGIDLSEYRYTAVLTLGVSWDSPWLVEGRYTDLRVVTPSGDEVLADSGSVISFIDSRGRFVVALGVHGDPTWLSLVVSSFSSSLLDGGFGCCGHIGGTFTANHREP